MNRRFFLTTSWRVVMPTIQNVVTIQANVQWIAFQSSSSKRFIGVCDMLNLSLEADSEDELRSLIPEAMNLLLADLLSDNELDQFLREKGWQAMNLPARVLSVATLA